MIPVITIGNFDAIQNAKGDWMYKAKDSSPLKKGTVKYKEKPQYPLQNEIEDNSKSRFNKVLNKTVLESVSFIKNNIQ